MDRGGQKGKEGKMLVEKEQSKNIVGGWGDTLLPRWGVYLASTFLESKENARTLSKGLVFLECSTKCHCYIVTALAHIANLFHSNLLCTGETKV